MPRQFDVTALGEAVIDLAPATSQTKLAYTVEPGGAPANVAAGVARLGLRAAMIAQVGADPFGHVVHRALMDAGVTVDTVAVSRGHNTPLAVVSYRPTGEASYFFYRENSADTNLTLNDAALQRIARSRILHVGTLLLATPVSATAQRQAVAHARSSEVAVSVDVNFRSNFWRETAAMVSAGREMVKVASVAKLSLDELAVLTEVDDVEAAARALWHDALLVLAVTDGPNGATLFTADERVSVAAFPVKTVDTIGCGDAFLSSLLTSVIEDDMKAPRGKALRTVALRASAAGALAAMRQGALESMPTVAEVNDFLSKRLDKIHGAPVTGEPGVTLRSTTGLHDTA